MGTVTGLFVDPDDNVWVLNRPEDESKAGGKTAAAGPKSRDGDKPWARDG